MALGAMAAGLIITGLGYKWTFWISGALSFVACLATWRWFKEERPGIAAVKDAAAPGMVSNLREMFSLDLPPNLWVLTVSAFIFNIGLTSSHSFYLLLFFKDKFGFSVTALGTIQMLHRFSLGIPMMLAGHLMDRPLFARHYRTLYIASMTVQGLSLCASAVIPGAYLACGVFLLHDIAGATFWSPIHSSFMQRYARPAQRGRDVALASGIASLGAIFGPLLAGLLIDRLGWKDGPFFMSGVITILASLLILRLRDAGGPRDADADAPGAGADRFANRAPDAVA
jgi:MFS family permease